MDVMSMLGKRVTERITPSAITEMMILVKEHNAISLTAGEPSSDVYPCLLYTSRCV